MEAKPAKNGDVNARYFGPGVHEAGIDLVGCSNDTLKNSFVRAWDDCLCVKTDNTGNSGNIAFSNCVIWVDLAQAMEIAYETR